MIDYVEIRGTNREVIGILDTANSIIWHSVWYGVGDFEIYAKANEQHLQLLQVGRYVTRPDDIEVGIIESIDITTDIESGAMITASGRFAKSILDRRLIYTLSGTSNKATVLSGRVENAVRTLMLNNAISCAFDTSRNISILELGANANIPLTIVDENGDPAEKQVSYENLLEYSDGLLEEYGLSATVILDEDTKKLQYVVMQGVDRSEDNAAGNEPIVFSTDYDNLSSSEYAYNIKPMKNVALIGGEGEGIERYYVLLAPAVTGLDRRELWVDAKSIHKKYKDDGGTERTYTDAQYAAMLKTQGKQKLAPLIAEESFTGAINVTAGNYILNRDFGLGDIVTVQENSIDKYVDVRIIEVTEVQDENGYSIDAKYE